MPKLLHSLLPIALLALTSGTLTPGAANATIINLAASIDCTQANAGAGTCGAGGTGTGSATITFDDVTNLLSWTVTWSGLSGTVTVAHFHGPALPTQNAGVQVGITAASPSVGNAVLSASQETDLLAGLWYLNIHSTTFPGGEIRGQVLVVPEPATVVLLVSGLFGLALRSRRT